METKNMIGGIISLAVVVICVAAIMMPVLSDATKTEATFDNTADALGYVTAINESYDCTFAWTPGETAVTVNGETVNFVANETVICKADDAMVRYTNGYFQYWTSTGLVTIGGPEQAFSLGITDGVMTISGDDITTVTKDVTGGYMLAASGDYVMKSSSQQVYMLADSEITAMGVTNMTGNVNVALTITGDVEEVEVTKLYPASTYTFDNITVVKEAVDGYNNLYKLSKITFVATDSSENTTNCTYSYFIVPAEVTAELSQHLDSAEIALLNAIPVLVIVALVIGAIGIAITSRRD